MGYAHYWEYSGAAPAAYACRWAEAQRLVAACTGAYQLQVHAGLAGLHVTGPNDKTSEPFVLGADGTAPIPPSFCTPRRWPYDDVVTACLLVMSQVPQFCISSDGTVEDWLDGQYLVSKHLGYHVNVVLTFD